MKQTGAVTVCHKRMESLGGHFYARLSFLALTSFPLSNIDNPYVLILSLVLANVRSLTITSSKQSALTLLGTLSEKVSDIHK
jgi:C4-dicarboxylate transporter